MRGVLRTESEDEAYAILEKDDLIPYRLRPVSTGGFSLVRLAPSLFSPRPQDIIDFTRQLAALLNSGIPLRRGLAAQRDQARNLGLKQALTEIIADIEGGARVHEAFARHTTVFPEFYLRMLRVGEATGGVAFALEQLTQNLRRRKAVTDRVRKALTYPAISLAVALVAATVLVTYSLPTLTDLLREFGGQLPVATRVMIAVSDWLQQYAFRAGAAAATLVAAGLIAQRTHRGKRLRDGFLLRLPVVGKILTASSMFTFSTNMSTLLRAGVSPIEALKLAQEGMGNTVIRDRIARSNQMAVEGMRLGEAFSERNGFPALLEQAIVMGEIRGSLVETLNGLAEYYEDVTELAVGSAMELIQPAIIRMIAGLVGFVAVAVISGIYTTLGTVH
ncbi:MAG: type II secretion system F family protein [SAR202 cluster bacterium]|nr:type II secretion system F family protein [SAR202 cluster bacterium]